MLFTYAQVVKLHELRKHPALWASLTAREPSRSRTIQFLISKGVEADTLYALKNVTGSNKYRFFEVIIALYGRLLK